MAKQNRMYDVTRIDQNLGRFAANPVGIGLWETWGGDSLVTPGSLEPACLLSATSAFLMAFLIH